MIKRILTISMAVALILVMALPMAIGAANPATGTTGVSGDIGSVYTLTRGQSSLTIGPFASAQAYTSSPDMSISVSTNDPGMTNVGIVVSNERTNAKGFLTLAGADDASKELTNALTVKGGAIGTYQSLATDKTLRAGTTPIGSANITDFSVQQTIASGDLTKTAGSYSLTMTFTATFN
jgi:hypothetical protein